MCVYALFFPGSRTTIVPISSGDVFFSSTRIVVFHGNLCEMVEELFQIQALVVGSFWENHVILGSIRVSPHFS